MSVFNRVMESLGWVNWSDHQALKGKIEYIANNAYMAGAELAINELDEALAYYRECDGATPRISHARARQTYNAIRDQATHEISEGLQ